MDEHDNSVPIPSEAPSVSSIGQTHDKFSDEEIVEVDAVNKPRLSSSTASSGEPVSGWQANLGNSIADYLEKLTVDKNLTARQVKKLLRAVLTNEDVIAAFRHYMNLNEPETGQPSASTKRCVKDLSEFLPPQLRRSLDLPLPATDSVQSIEPRVVTRSVARTVQNSLRNYLQVDESDQTSKSQCTILDMEFPDDEGDEDGDVAADLDRPTGSGPDDDEEYHPGPIDMKIFHRDRLLDMPTGEVLSDKSMSMCLDESVSSVSLVDENSQQSTVESIGGPKTNLELNSWLTEDVAEASSDLDADVTLNNEQGSNFNHSQSNVESSESAVWHRGHKKSPVLVSETTATTTTTTYNRLNDDTVYAEFLRTLFASDESAQNSPNKKKRKPPVDDRTIVSSMDPPRIQSPTSRTPVVEDDEDPDDPEFDVMAELDHVNREDFFDELRDDRAVRVSKLEAKSLHQDLYNLFSDDDDDDVNQIDANLRRTSGPRASEVYAMTSRCHRLMMQSNRITKSDTVERPAGCASTPSPETGSPSRNSVTAQMRLAFDNRCLSADQQKQLQRQLGMHVQLLTTHFLCTYDRSAWHTTVTRPCASALKALVSCRDAFDLMAQQRQKDRGLQPNNLRSFYWSCSTLNDAVSLITNYAGLSRIPKLPPDCYRNPYNPYRRLGWSHYPLPLCLIRIMLDSPIWSYPYLMPTILPTPPDPSNPAPQKRRIVFNNSEDALILLGLTDFAKRKVFTVNKSPSTNQSGSEGKTGGGGTNQRLFGYRLIQRHLLPHRHLQQIRVRRCNLVTALSPKPTGENHREKDVGKHTEQEEDEEETAMGSQLQSPNREIDQERSQFATRCLHKFYSRLTDSGTFDVELLEHLASLVAPTSIPHQITPRCGPISSLDYPGFLFERIDGLPTGAGYERLLLSTNPSRAIRGEFSKLIHDMLTDFVEECECLWWSDSTQAVHQLGSAVASNLTENSAQLAPCAVLKPDHDASQISITESPSTGNHYNLLGPTFLPALPVDITSDGNVVLSQTAEPTLLEFRSSAYEGLENLPSTSKRVRIDGSRPEQSVSKHIESLLREIRAQFMRNHWSRQEPIPSVLSQRTLSQLSCTPSLSGKVPLPRLPVHVSRQRIWRKYQSASMRRSRRASRRVFSLSHSAVAATARPNKTVQQSVPGSVQGVQPPRSTIIKEPHLLSCQQSAQKLCEQFHYGLDKLVVNEPQKQSEDVACGSFSNYNRPPIPDAHPDQADLPTPVSSSGLPSCSSASANTSVFSHTCMITSWRFLNRCKARGEATSADLFVLPSSLSAQRQTSLDDFDVHHARAFLDACRASFDAPVYATLVFSLRKLDQLLSVQTASIPSKSPATRPEIIQQLTQILNLLKINRNLWEDFICLLTPDQVRCLGLLPVYAYLVRIGRVHCILQDLVPRGKRFWIRLFNLANFAANNTAAATTTTAGVNKNGSTSHTPPKLTAPTTLNKTLWSGVGRRALRKRFVPYPISKTWEVLEGSWRNRPVLMSQLASLLDATCKPYSGFEQSFEDIDLLARKPLDRSSKVASNEDPGGERSFDDLVKEWLQTNDNWEICNSLSAASRRHSPTKPASKLPHKHCHCPCHMGDDEYPHLSSKSSLRHCISCSLRVHCGTVYVDEFNRHLRPVNIIWPVDFVPTNVVRRKSNGKRTKKRPISESSCQATNVVRPTNCPTRSFLSQLARSHQLDRSGCVTSLPDAANRRVSIEFIPPIKPECTIPSENVSQIHSTVVTCPSEASSPPPPSPTPLPKSPTTLTSSSVFMDNDDAACFNTEAFPSTPVAIKNDAWHCEEDRQLLTFCKLRGRYSSAMFKDLACMWVPKPEGRADGRSAVELESRFKYLMRLTLGLAYDQELFCSPQREESD